MSRDPALVTIVTAIANHHALKPAFVCAIVEHESQWNPWAVRYETDFFTRYVRTAYLAGKFGVTEAQSRTMSFGLMQVMGEVAREFGFKGDFLTELCDPHIGVEFGCRIITKRLAEQSGSTVGALLAYNGGADPNYPGKVFALMPSYETPGEVKA
jgi:soluble lytic murein transglycosylase-like protein